MVRRINSKRLKRQLPMPKHKIKSAKQNMAVSSKNKTSVRRPSSKIPRVPEAKTSKKKELLRQAASPSERLNPTRRLVQSPPGSPREVVSEVVSLYVPSEQEASPAESDSIINKLREAPQDISPVFRLSSVNMFRIFGGRIRDLTDPANF